MTQCKALTDYVNEEQCSRQAKVKINGVGFCIPHAAKICLQQAIKDGVVEPINPEDWFYKKVINKTVKIHDDSKYPNWEQVAILTRKLPRWQPKVFLDSDETNTKL